VDRHSLTQVIVNLLVNAEQATAARHGRFGIWWGRSSCR
jgi:hypothetical protein